MIEVTLQVAFQWLCPQCTTTNFVSGVPFEHTEEDRLELLNDGILSDELDDCIMKPGTVKCWNCLERFKVVENES